MSLAGLHQSGPTSSCQPVLQLPSSGCSMVPRCTRPAFCILLLACASASAFAAPMPVLLRDGTQQAGLPAVVQLGTSASYASRAGKSLLMMRRFNSTGNHPELVTGSSLQLAETLPAASAGVVSMASGQYCCCVEEASSRHPHPYWSMTSDKSRLCVQPGMGLGWRYQSRRPGASSALAQPRAAIAAGVIFFALPPTYCWSLASPSGA